MNTNVDCCTHSDVLEPCECGCHCQSEPHKISFLEYRSAQHWAERAYQAERQRDIVQAECTRLLLENRKLRGELDYGN